MHNHTHSQILVVNVGGQYCHLITRRIRDLGVHAKICNPEDVLRELPRTKGIIVSGGPSSVYSPESPSVPSEMFAAKIPVLGICYGHQVMAHALGGEVKPGTELEYGEVSLRVVDHDTILKGTHSRETVWMSHGDEVVTPPPGFLRLAETDSCHVAAMSNPGRKLFGLQFHPEVSHTICGTRILENFVFDVCRCEKDWSTRGILDKLRNEIRQQVGQREVLFFVSGGVDSTVAFTLATDALGPERVLGIFVDTGLMRYGEPEQIQRICDERGWHNVRLVNESKMFMDALENVTDPERKRHIIGDCFIKVQQKLSSQLQLSPDNWMLGQGTIYPDTIESGKSAGAATIKTHHNRVPAIEALINSGLVLEPLKEFYKDEVRTIGRELGLPEALVSKHPFPGPGLAVRCLGSEKSETLRQTSELDEIAGSVGLVAWSVPLRTVGVQGDHRSYSDLVILAGGDDLSVYGEAARRITRKVRGTNRIAFLVSPLYAGALDGARVRKASIDKSRVELLRSADAVVQEAMEANELQNDIWQFPVVLLPLTLGSGDTIALRPVSSSDAMTARHANLPMRFIQELGSRLISLPGIDMVVYDVTDKPPATIEWE